MMGAISQLLVDLDGQTTIVVTFDVGLSMGGVESLEIGLNHLDQFSYVAGFSAAVTHAEFPKNLSKN